MKYDPRSTLKKQGQGFRCKCHFNTRDSKVKALQELQLNKKKATFAEHCSQFFQARDKQVLKAGWRLSVF